MGIRFLCPNGHKLNVKSFLAGKKAICPKCGIRVVVPEADADAGQDSDILATDVAATAAEGSASGVSSDVSGAVWYVRPASGGQFGPASSEIMQAWISEGRVGADALVWCAGWPEWRSASATFPQLMAGQRASTAAAMTPAPALANSSLAAPNGTAPALGVPLPVGHTVQSLSASDEGVDPSTAVAPLPQPMRRRRPPSNNNNLMVSVILVVISIILVIILVIVTRENGEEPQDESTPSKTTAVMLEQRFES